MQIARAYGRAVYDCVYVALAVETSTHLVTADEKLANSLPGMPVTWLGLI
jgi:predicted nucleic acid-binding protein